MACKWMGAGLIFLACGGFGIRAAGTQRQEEAMLRQLVGIMDYMACELQYRLTPLPELCMDAAKQVSGQMGKVIYRFGQALTEQLSPEVSGCMHSALSECDGLPRQTRTALVQLGNSLGRFDLPGQIRGLDALRSDCRRMLEELQQNRDSRLRSYQTLGFCAGAALAILFM